MARSRGGAGMAAAKICRSAPAVYSLQRRITAYALAIRIPAEIRGGEPSFEWLRELPRDNFRRRAKPSARVRNSSLGNFEWRQGRIALRGIN